MHPLPSLKGNYFCRTRKVCCEKPLAVFSAGTGNWDKKSMICKTSGNYAPPKKDVETASKQIS